MKYILLLLLAVPAFAFEESGPLKYTYLGISQSKSTGYAAPLSDFTNTGIFASTRLTDTLFFGAAIGFGKQDVGSISATVTEYDLMLGGRSPINEQIDATLSVSLASANVSIGSNSYSGTGNVISLGVRGMIIPSVEGSANLNQSSVSINGNSTSQSYLSVGAGIHLNERIQFNLGAGFSKYPSTSIGVLFYYN